jgi:hypothetical protein
MAISVNCPSCARQYSVKEEAAGKKFKCKDCGAVVQVPDGGAGGGGDAFSEDYGDPYNPYADDEMAAGGAPPPMATRRPKKRSGGSKAAAAERTKLPAIFLMIIVCLSFLNHAGGIVMHFMGIEAFPMGPAQNEAEEIGRMVGGVVGGVVGLGADALVFFGALALLRVSSYGMAMTGSILAVIPCLSPCCVLGIPFGIWALVVLNDESVKAGFG